MQEIVINYEFGGFGLSIKAIDRYCELKGIQPYHYTSTVKDLRSYFRLEEPYSIPNAIGFFITLTKDYGESVRGDDIPNGDFFSERDIPRDDPGLVQVVKELGEAANGRLSALKVIEIPDGVEWQIEEYDGSEWVAEVHQTWH